MRAWMNIKGAMIGIASADHIGNLVPGFQEQY
jgi:hypothetical protein